jgi:hypothetical protein
VPRVASASAAAPGSPPAQRESPRYLDHRAGPIVPHPVGRVAAAGWAPRARDRDRACRRGADRVLPGLRPAPAPGADPVPGPSPAPSPAC